MIDLLLASDLPVAACPVAFAILIPIYSLIASTTGSYSKEILGNHAVEEGTNYEEESGQENARNP